MTLQEFYAQIGGNYADTVRRLCNESLVLRFVKKYPANPSMDELRAAIGQQDWEPLSAPCIRSRALRRTSASTVCMPSASR